MRNFKNNAIAKLKLPLSSSSKLIVLEDWHWEKFPTSNFKWSVVKFDENEKVLRREIVEIEARTWDRLEVKNRAFEETPRSDGSPTSEKTAFNFDVWDVFINSVFASDFKDIETRFEENEAEIGKKLNISDESVTKEWNTFNLPNKLLKLDENWKLPELDWSKLINLTASPFVFGDWSDWVLNVLNWNTVELNTDKTYNFSSVNIENGGILTIQKWDNNDWLKIKCKWEFVLNWEINLTQKGFSKDLATLFWDVKSWKLWNGWNWGSGWGSWSPYVTWVGWLWKDWYGWWWGWWSWYKWSWGDGWEWGYPWGLWGAGWTSYWSWWAWVFSSGGWGWWNASKSGWKGWDAYWLDWQSNVIDGGASSNWAWWGSGWTRWESWSSVLIYAYDFKWSWSIISNWSDGWNGWNWGWGWSSGWKWWGWWGGGWGWSWAIVLVWHNNKASFINTNTPWNWWKWGKNGLWNNSGKDGVQWTSWEYLNKVLNEII